MNFDEAMKIVTNMQWFALGMCAGMLFTIAVVVTCYVLIGP